MLLPSPSKLIFKIKVLRLDHPLESVNYQKFSKKNLRTKISANSASESSPAPRKALKGPEGVKGDGL